MMCFLVLLLGTLLQVIAKAVVLDFPLGWKNAQKSEERYTIPIDAFYLPFLMTYKTDQLLSFFFRSSFQRQKRRYMQRKRKKATCKKNRRYLIQHLIVKVHAPVVLFLAVLFITLFMFSCYIWCFRFIAGKPRGRDKDIKKEFEI